jgi:hypothetical protein
MYQRRTDHNIDLDKLWCTDYNTKSLSLFDIKTGTHTKSISQEQINQLPVMAVSDIVLSPILEKEMAIHINTDNYWGFSIVHGCLGDREYPDGFVKMLNHLQLYNKSTWRLPSILEFEQICRLKKYSIFILNYLFGHQRNP